MVDVDIGQQLGKMGQRLPERAYCLASYKTGEEHQIVVGCDDNRLRFFSLPDWIEGKCSSDPADLRLQQATEQALEESPVALSTIEISAAPATNPFGHDLHDLLVFDRNGWLRRWRRLANKRIHACWHRLWEEQCAGIQPHWLESADTWLNEDRRRKCTIAHRALAYCLENAEEITPPERNHYLERLPELFRVFRQHRSLPRAALDRLIDSVRSYLQHSRPAYPLPQGGDFAAALLFRLYTEECQLADRSRIGMEFSNLEKTDDPWLQRLRRYRRPESVEGTGENADLAVWRLSRRLEHWANALWPIQEDRLKSVDIVALCGIANDQQQWLVGATRQTLYVYRRTEPEAMLQPAYEQTMADERILAIATLPAAVQQKPALAVAVKRHQRIAVKILALESAPPPCLRAIATVELGQNAFSVVLASCPGHAGGSRLAVLANQGRQALLSLLDIDEHGAVGPHSETRTLEIAWIRAADMALAQQGYWLAVGTDQAPISCLYRIDLEGDCREQRRFNIFRRGNLAACFDSKCNPRYLLVGGRGGYLQCTDLQRLGQVSDSHWVYRQRGAVQFIHALEYLEYQEQRCFLVGARNGDIALLRADDGNRLWKASLPYGALHAGIYNEPGLQVAVYQGRQRLTTFTPNNPADVDCVLQKTATTAHQWPPESHDVWSWSRAMPLYAIYRAKFLGESLRQALAAADCRDGRPRLLRYALQEPRLRAEIAEAVPALESRDLVLLLNYAGAEDADFLPPIRLKLCRHHRWLERHNGKLTHSAMAAMTTWLQHWRRYKPSLADILEYLPPREFFLEFNWINRSFALLLLEAVQRETGSGQKLLPALLKPLLRLPPGFIERLYPLLNPSTPDAQDVADLLSLLDTAVTDSTPHPALRRLAECFNSSSSPPMGGLLAALLRLHAVHAEQRGIAWKQWRHVALAAMDGLRLALSHCHTLDAPMNVLVDGLRQRLLDEAAPADTQARELHLEWVGRVKNKLAQHITGQAPAWPNEPDWPDYLQLLAYNTGKALQQQMDEEYRHLLDMVRPRLNLLALQRGEHGRIELSLRSEPEAGDHRLHDVTIIYTVDLPAASKDRCQRRHYQFYPAPGTEETLVFSGFIPNETAHIEVAVELIAGYCHREIWRFPLPAAQAEETIPLPPAVAAVYRDFCHSVFAEASPLAIVAIDKAFGQARLLADWDKHYPQCRLDVDSLLNNQCLSRQYSANLLRLERVEPQLLHPFSELKRRKAGEATPPLLLGPLDENLERLLAQAYCFNPGKPPVADGESLLLHHVDKLCEALFELHQGLPVLKTGFRLHHISRLLDLDVLVCLHPDCRWPDGERYDWPTVALNGNDYSNDVLKNGSQDSHIHLGGVLPPLFYWTALMSGEIPLDMLDFSPTDENPTPEGKRLWHNALWDAAYLRLRLAAAVQSYGEKGEKPVFSHLPKVKDSALWAPFCGKAVRPSCFAQIRDWTLDLSHRQRMELPQEKRCCPWIDPLRLDPGRGHSCHYAQGERRLLVAVGRLLRAPRRADAKSPLFRDLETDLRKYLRLRNALHAKLVHDHGTDGLLRFVRNFDRRRFLFSTGKKQPGGGGKTGTAPANSPNPKAKVAERRRRGKRKAQRRMLVLERQRMATALEMQLHEAFEDPEPQYASPNAPLRGMEMRVTVPDPNVFVRTMHAWLLGIRDFLTAHDSLAPPPGNGDGQSVPVARHAQVGLVFHFIKFNNTVETEDSATQQAQRLMAVLRDYPRLRRYVVGIDAAGYERYSAPRQFAPAFRQVAGQAAELRPRPEEPRIQLGYTYHAGEDADDMLTALRHIDEAVSLLYPAAGGGRIGHALLLGEPPELFYRQRRFETEATLGTHLLDLVWAQGKLAENRLPEDVAWLQQRIVDLAGTRLPRVEHCYSAMRDGLGGTGQVKSEAELLRALRFSGDANQPITIMARCRWLPMLETVQTMLRKELSRRKVCIESNPTSNLLIGGYSDYQDLPYRRLVEADLPLSLNTDDPGLFFSCLPGEFSAIYHGLAAMDMPHRDILAWLEQRLTDARQASFLFQHVPIGAASPILTPEGLNRLLRYQPAV